MGHKARRLPSVCMSRIPTPWSSGPWNALVIVSQQLVASAYTQENGVRLRRPCSAAFGLDIANLSPSARGVNQVISSKIGRLA